MGIVFLCVESGSSDDPCNEVYAGEKVFSEPESRAIRDFVLPRASQMDAFITLHTYSQIWVHGFGHERQSYPTDVRELVYKSYTHNKTIPHCIRVFLRFRISWDGKRQTLWALSMERNTKSEAEQTRYVRFAYAFSNHSLVLYSFFLVLWI